MPGRPSLHEIAVMAARRAVREGASEAEVYIVRERGFTATASSSRVEGLNAVDEVGLGVRVAVGRRTGFAYTTSLALESIGSAVREAVKIARTSREDGYWPGFPLPSNRYPEPRAIYSSSLANSSPEDVVEDLGVVISTAREENAVLVDGAVHVSTVERVLVNTNGVYRIDVGTIAAVFVEVAIKTEKITTPGIYELESSRVSIPSPESVTRRALEKAKLCLRREKIDSPRRMAVVFSPKTFASLLRATLLEALLGDNVVRERSVFRNRVGEQVAVEELSIVDDGTLPGGDNTWRFDGEGVAMQKTVLVEKGVLRGFIYDYYWASRAGVESTGNAVRAGYASRPHPGFTNIVVAPGGAEIEELLEGGEVLYIEEVQGAHTSNPETGEYSVLTNPAILYRRGEPVGWTPGVMVAGNMYKEILEQLSMLGREVFHPSTGFYLPPARFEGIAVAPKHG